MQVESSAMKVSYFTVSLTLAVVFWSIETVISGGIDCSVFVKLLFSRSTCAISNHNITSTNIWDGFLISQRSDTYTHKLKHIF